MPSTPNVLPSSVSLGSSTWFGRARNFPVFSRDWLRYRSQAHVLGLMLIFIVSTCVLGLGGRSWEQAAFDMGRPWLSLLGISLCGPALATWVRARHWPPRREFGALAGALVLGASLGFGGMRLVYALTETSSLANSAGQESAARNGGVPLSDATMPSARKAGAMALFALLALWLGGGFDLLAFRRQRKRLLALEGAQALAAARQGQAHAEMKLAVLAAQVEPHFLFNTLAGVRSAITIDPPRAAAMVDHLVDYLRASIPQMRDEAAAGQVSLGSQLDVARAYLGLMQARMARLQFSVECEQGLDTAALPPLLLISLIENAIKHGIEPKVGPGTVTVSATRQDAQLHVCVSDDGVGFGGATSGSGIGLANITQRLDTLYGKRAALSLQARPEGGVRAILTLPLSMANR
jgi:signal transduction histidine kinase